ncbi:MAG: hypothetical protein JNM43_09160 [Planctomycetaceae bacterium]|nr:hypothetical protein [Planctomycetaceae bacterium]
MTDGQFVDNPYAVESAVVEPAVSTSEPKSGSWLRTGWVAVVVMNLPIPWMFGSTCCKETAMIGMPIGILVVLIAGFWGCRQVPKTMTMLNSGAVITGLSQFWPMLHIVIGSMAVGISQWLFEDSGNSTNLTKIPSATLATLITGAGLILVSFVFGAVLLAFASIFRRR